MIDPYNENYVIRELGWGWEWKWGKNKSLKALVNNIPSRSPEPSQSSKVALLAYLYRREEVCFLKKLSKSVSILVEIRHSQKKKRGMKWKIYISNSNTESPLSLPARTQIPVITRLIYHSTAPPLQSDYFFWKNSNVSEKRPWGTEIWVPKGNKLHPATQSFWLSFFSASLLKHEGVIKGYQAIETPTWRERPKL